jgi:UDP-GlcNAc:undecaprenyl-phosphate/decaprenyl-phosphate GlcNAc-1-phosphate transferase
MDENNLLTYAKIAFIILFTILIARESIRLSFQLLKDAGCNMKNYRGKEVIFSMGIAFLPIIISSTALSLLMNRNQLYNYVSYLFAVFAIGFIGLMDDLIGKKNIKGLKNHIVSFLRGRLTTGFIKAFIGFTISIIISFGISDDNIDFILNIFNIALFTNALNIMDLRPGRCTKIFLIISLAIIFTNLKDAILLLPLIIMLVSAIVYIPYDLNELCLLGDTGSNVFGITLGYFSSLVFESTSKTFIFLVLITINLAAEKVSITEIISNNKILNYLDSLGRSRG